jgi:hypothetical protein
MKTRCYNSNAQAYHNYGGRGIGIAAEWLADAEQFVAWALSNHYAEGLEIDRLENDGHYAPDNCRFVPAKQNVRNRRKTLFVEHQGVQRSLGEVFEELTGLSASSSSVRYTCVVSRINHGWDVATACRTPIGKPGRPRKLHR